MRVWVASLIFYCSVWAVCELFRWLIKSKTVKVPEKWLPLVLEFIGTIQVCAPMFDVNIILENYGLQGVVGEITLIELVNLILLRDAVADPCPLIIDFFKKRISIQKLVAFIGTQFAGAYFSYLLVLGFWRIGLHPKHLELLSDRCESDLTVTMLIGSLVEAGGLIINKASEKFLEGKIHVQNVLSFATALVAGIHLTGMYANPIVAWACTFNCGEVPHLAHFVVYWLAPVVAHLAWDKFNEHNGKEIKTE